MSERPTTLYTRVARCPEIQAASPLDILTEKRPPSPRAPVPTHHRVNLRLELERTADTQANASILIRGEGPPLRLEGITIKQPRPGWITLYLPPEEDWMSPTASEGPRCTGID